MNKKVLGSFLAFTLSTGLASASGSSHTSASATHTSSNSAAAVPDASDSFQTQLLEQVLKSVSQVAVNFNINGATFDTTQGADSKQSVLQIQDGEASVLALFKSDWSVQLITPTAGGSTAQDSLQQVFPKLQAAANNLIVGANAVVKQNKRQLDVNFYSSFNQTTQQGVAHPLVLRVTNNFSSTLLTVQIHSLHAEEIIDPNDSNNAEISGSCKTDKFLFDLRTKQTTKVPANCSFKGTKTKAGYKINFTYVSTPQS